MTWILVLSGSEGFVIPNIILGAFIYACYKHHQTNKQTNINIASHVKTRDITHL
jgi:hypothetical protein